MEERKLYPMKFCTVQNEYVWGTEEFRLADLGYRDSLVREGWLAGNSIGELMDTYFDRIPGEKAYEFFGRQFPLCVRKLSCRGRMPLQVHPDDETAGQRYDLLGKEKLWYVLRAGKGAGLMLGFRHGSNASEFYSACADGSVEKLLNIVAPYAGQCLLIPSGTPHAAFGDIELLEIAESSPLDFCLCGWGEEVSEEQFDPVLTATDAMDFINYGRYESSVPAGDRLADIPQFTVDMLKLSAPMRISSGGEGPFTIYCCLEGAASLQTLSPDGTETYPMGKGELLLVPSECEDVALVPEDRGTVLLEATVNRVEQDGYINPDAEATLPDEDDKLI